MADSSYMQSNVRGKAPKYTAGCDSRNKAKVRCSQTRPSCARCLKVLNSRCTYSVSKRSGKHRAEGSTRAEGTTKAEGITKNGTITEPPVKAPSMTGMEALSISRSTIDPRECLQPFTASGVESSVLLNGQQLQKDWTSENGFFVRNQSSTIYESPANYESNQFMSRKDESHTSNVQGHGQDLIHGTAGPVLGSCSRDHSVSDQAPSYTQSKSPCASCNTTDPQNDNSSPMVDTCRCNEEVVMQISLLPVLLLDNECSTFNVKLAQFQKAIRLCTGVLACTCPGKDYTSILTIGMLIARIISFFEHGGARAGRENDNSASSLDKTGASTPVQSAAKFSVGTYEIDGEEKNALKREVWWLQIRKVESLVAGFKEMVDKMTQQQIYQDNAEAAVWGKLVFLLDQKALEVKRDWSFRRNKA